MALTLVIGNKNYSSWSMRPWLLLRHSGLAFEEILVSLYQPEFATRIRQYSGAGKVPVLIEGDLHVWDSLAICEYLAERAGSAWPRDASARALARSVSAEMHSGFQTLRARCPMNARARNRRVPLTPELLQDVRRIEEIWRECRQRHGRQGDGYKGDDHKGSWLFGDFSIADAMYAPVVLRFQTYGVGDLAADTKDYMNTVLADRHVIEWLRAGEAETYAEEATDAVGR